MKILLATEGSQRAKKAERVTSRLSKAYNLHTAALFAVSFMNTHSASEAEGKKPGVEMEKILEIGHIGSSMLKVSRTLKVHTLWGLRAGTY